MHFIDNIEISETAGMAFVIVPWRFFQRSADIESAFFYEDASVRKLSMMRASNGIKRKERRATSRAGGKRRNRRLLEDNAANRIERRVRLAASSRRVDRAKIKETLGASPDERTPSAG